MKGRLVSLFYNTRQGKTPLLHASIRTQEDKYDFEIESPIYPYCFANPEDIQGLNPVMQNFNARVELQKDAIIYQKDKSTKVVKVTVDDPLTIKILRNIFQKKNKNLYEADIPFQNRVMLDMDLGVAVEISEGKISNFNGNIPEPRVLFFDTETDDSEGFPEPGSQRILAYGCVDGQTGEEHGFCENDERVLISKFIDYAKDFDVLVEYTDFDSETLVMRCRKIGIPFRRDQLEFVDFKAIYEIRSDREEENYTLDYLAEKYLHIKIPRSKSYMELFKKDKEHIKNICTSHARVVYMLEKQFGLVQQTVKLCDRFGLLPSDGTYAHKFTDMAIMRQLIKLNPRIVVPCREQIGEKRTPYKGAMVLEPKTGVWKNVAKLDFVSMYPNLMLTANVSPEYYVPDLEVEKLLAYCSKLPIGVLQKILRRGLELRMEYKKAMKAIESQGKKFTTEWEMARRQDYFAKVLINAIYGSYGETNSRFYTRKFAEIITLLGRSLLESTRDFVNAKGEYEVVYGDTDSCFILMNNKSVEECKSKAVSLQKYLNSEFYPKFLEKFGIPVDKQHMKIEYADIYTDLLLVERKKKYAGIVYGQKEPEIVGFEKVRSDWPSQAKDIQEDVILMVLHHDNPENIVKYMYGVRQSVLDGKLNSKLVMSKGLRQKPHKYKAIKAGHKPPPHVRAALELQKLGVDVKTGKIAYVFSAYNKGNLVVKPLVNGEVPKIEQSGLEYYWRHSLFPPTRRILEVINIEDYKLKELETGKAVSRSHQLDTFMVK